MTAHKLDSGKTDAKLLIWNVLFEVPLILPLRFLEGSGTGINKFLVHHQGGGWCETIHNCAYQSIHSQWGSSKLWRKDVTCKGEHSKQARDDSTPHIKDKKGGLSIPCFEEGGMDGLLSYNPLVNPLTYNWNKIWIPYCDGASFMGDQDETTPVDFSFFKGGLYFRGAAIIKAVYDNLIKDFGVDKATDVIISGSSAGGLTVMLHIDRIARWIKDSSKLDKSPRVVGVSDAGYFLDVKSYRDERFMMKDLQNFEGIYKFQNVKGSLYSECLAEFTEEEGWKCMLPQYFMKYIKTPMFYVQSIVDGFQWSFVFQMECKLSEDSDCSGDEIHYLKRIRKAFANGIRNDVHEHDGYWITKCQGHTIVNKGTFWNQYDVNGNRLGESLIAWYENYEDTSRSHEWRSIDDAWDTRNMKCKRIEAKDARKRLGRHHSAGGALRHRVHNGRVMEE